MKRDIKAEEAHPMNVAKQNQGMGTHVLTVQPQKTAPIIDADAYQIAGISPRPIAQPEIIVAREA